MDIKDVKHTVYDRSSKKELPSLNDTVYALGYHIENLRSENEALKKKLANINTQVAIDAEVAKLKAEIDRLSGKGHYSFILSEEEQKAAEEWEEQHLKKHSKYVNSAIGGMFTYSFVPTSIGEIITIKCVCGEEFTVRDL